MNKSDPIQRASTYIFVAGLALIIILPIMYFLFLSFFSGYEAFKFPQGFLPKTSFDLKVEWADNKYNVVLYNRDTKDYDSLIATNRMIDISRLLKRQLSISKTVEELENDFKSAKDSGISLNITYQKDMLYNYKSFFSVTNNAAKAMKNSLFAALWTVLISLSIGSMAGYAMARYKFKGRAQMNLTLLIVRMFPIVAISIPLAVDLIRFGLFDNMLGLAIIYSIPNIALTAWITYSIFLGISAELEEASFIFGAGKIKTFFKITLPLAFPGLAASSMYAFLTAWNDTITALILTSDNQTLSLVIYKALGGNDTQLQLAAAGSVILIIPALIFTFIIKNYIGQMWGDVKL